MKLLGLDEEIRRFNSTGGWSRSFSIVEDTYRVTTLEVLSTIEMDYGLTSFDRVGSIRFQLFGVQHAMSYIKFVLLMGLYDSAFTTTHDYDQLLVDCP